jgi:hypothetical protein
MALGRPPICATPSPQNIALERHFCWQRAPIGCGSFTRAFAAQSGRLMSPSFQRNDKVHVAHTFSLFLTPKLETEPEEFFIYPNCFLGIFFLQFHFASRNMKNI